MAEGGVCGEYDCGGEGFPVFGIVCGLAFATEAKEVVAIMVRCVRGGW